MSTNTTNVAAKSISKPPASVNSKISKLTPPKTNTRPATTSHTKLPSFTVSNGSTVPAATTAAVTSTVKTISQQSKIIRQPLTAATNNVGLVSPTSSSVSSSNSVFKVPSFGFRSQVAASSAANTKPNVNAANKPAVGGVGGGTGSVNLNRLSSASMTSSTSSNASSHSSSSSSKENKISYNEKPGDKIKSPLTTSSKVLCSSTANANNVNKVKYSATSPSPNSVTSSMSSPTLALNNLTAASAGLVPAKAVSNLPVPQK